MEDARILLLVMTELLLSFLLFLLPFYTVIRSMGGILSSLCLVTFYRATACNATHGIAVAILSVCLSAYQTRVLLQN